MIARQQKPATCRRPTPTAPADWCANKIARVVTISAARGGG